MKVDSGLILISMLSNVLGLDTLSNTDNQVSFQRKVYLLQLAGMPLGCCFRLYPNGPYSKTLAQNIDIYLLHKDKIDRAAVKFQISEGNKRRIADIMLLFNLPTETDEDSIWWELLASLHCLARYSLDTSEKFKSLFQTNQDKVRDTIAECLREDVKNHALVNSAWERIVPFLKEKRRIAAPVVS